MLSEKDVSIITQVAFKGAVEAQSKPLDTNEGQAEFAVTFSFLKNILFGEVADSPTPSGGVAEASNVVQGAFPGTVALSIKGSQHGPLPEWLIDQAAAVGVTEVWDNRDRLAEGQAKGKQWPWFRSAHDNIDKAFWPPRAA